MITPERVSAIVQDLVTIANQRARSSVEAMRKGHNVMSADMLKDAVKLNDAIDVLCACYEIDNPNQTT